MALYNEFKIGNSMRTVCIMDIQNNVKILGEVGNVLGLRVGQFSKLPGNQTYYIPELGVECVGSCGNHCVGCGNPNACYVYKAMIRHTKKNEDGTKGNYLENECSVKLGYAINTIAMRSHLVDVFQAIDMQLGTVRKKFDIIRIHVSGEIESQVEFIGWCTLMQLHQETKAYLYTKAYDDVLPALLKGIVPMNFHINISIWGEQGIEEFNKVKHLSNVHAFVYVDNVYTKEWYAAHGLEWTTWCPAYTRKGKMLHNSNSSCVACKRCYTEEQKNKVIFCFSH